MALRVCGYAGVLCINWRLRWIGFNGALFRFLSDIDLSTYGNKNELLPIRASIAAFILSGDIAS
jgi:hypothetical protein